MVLYMQHGCILLKDSTAGYAKDHLTERFLKQQLWKPTGLVNFLVYHT